MEFKAFRVVNYWCLILFLGLLHLVVLNDGDGSFRGKCCLCLQDLSM
jgi:hypothetical protein